MKGLTKEGFIRETFEEIKTRINQRYIDVFGDIDTSDTTVPGTIIDIDSTFYNDIFFALEAVYNSQYPSTATGSSLDGVCEYNGITRLAPTATRVNVELLGRNNVLVPKDAEATITNTNYVFKNSNNILLTNESCLKIRINIPDISISDYNFIINNEPISYSKNISDTKDDIINALVQLIVDLNLDIEAVNLNSVLVINTTDDKKPIAIYFQDGFEILDVMNKSQFVCTTKGSISVPAKSLVNIQTPVFGWLSIINNSAGLLGRDLETDEDFRLRRIYSMRVGGTATVEAIRARILNTGGVISAKVKDNRENVEVNGIPAHAVHILVKGGLDEDVAYSIWNTIAAGTQMIGNTTVLITDSEGFTQPIIFSRPEDLYIYVKITIDKEVNNYPLDGDDKIKNAIVTQINKLSVGEDVIYQSFYKSVYSVPGIISALIEIGGTTDELVIPFYNSANIIVADAQQAVTDISKISIL